MEGILPISTDFIVGSLSEGNFKNAGENPAADESNDLVSLAQKLANLSDEQVFDSVVTGDTETIQLMAQFGGFSNSPFPKPEEIEEFFGRIFDALGKDIFRHSLKIDEIGRFCAFGCSVLPEGAPPSKKHAAAQLCAVTIASWEKNWGFALEQLEQQLTAAELSKGASLTGLIEKMLDVITTIEIKQQENKDVDMGRGFLYNMNVATSAADADAFSGSAPTEVNPARSAAAVGGPSHLTTEESLGRAIIAASAIAAVPDAAPSSPPLDPGNRTPSPELPSNKEKFPAVEPLSLARGAGGSKGLPDPWEKLAKDYRTAPSAPDLLLNNSVFDDQDLSTQLDMLQPMLGQLAAAEQPSASDDDDEDFDLEDEGAQPFLPSWVTPVSEDQRVRMRVDSGRAAIEDNDCTWQNAAEHAFETRIHKFNRTRPLRGGSTQKYILMSLLASRNMELDRKTHPGVYITFGYRSHRFRTATMRGDARVVLLNWRDSDGPSDFVWRLQPSGTMPQQSIEAVVVGSTNTVGQHAGLGIEQDSDLIIGDGRLLVPQELHRPKVCWMRVAAAPRRPRKVLEAQQRTAGELLVGVAVVDGTWFDEKESELIFAREFPIDKDEVYRDRLGSQPSANQLQLEHGYPAYYCLLFTVVRATGLNRNTFAQKMQSDSSKWLYAVISHGQFSFKTRMVNAAVADWTKPMYGSDEVAGSDLICPLSNNLLEQQYVKVTLYTYWRDKDGFAEQKLGSTRVHFKDGIAVNKVVKMDYAMDEGGQLLVQYAVFDRKVLGEMLFPKIKSEQHRQEVRRFCKRRKRHPTTRYTGLRLGATALTPRVDTPTSPTVENTSETVDFKNRAISKRALSHYCERLNTIVSNYSNLMGIIEGMQDNSPSLEGNVYSLHNEMDNHTAQHLDPASRITSKLDQLLSYLVAIDHWQHSNEHRYKMMILERNRKKQQLRQIQQLVGKKSAQIEEMAAREKLCIQQIGTSMDTLAKIRTAEEKRMEIEVGKQRAENSTVLLGAAKQFEHGYRLVRNTQSERHINLIDRLAAAEESVEKEFVKYHRGLMEQDQKVASLSELHTQEGRRVPAI